MCTIKDALPSNVLLNQWHRRRNKLMQPKETAAKGRVKVWISWMTFRGLLEPVSPAFALWWSALYIALR